VKSKFVELYWGNDGDGNVSREEWLLPPAILRRLSKRSALALFTGRTRKELDHTLDMCNVRKFFADIVTVEDVKRPKPDPEGLFKILKNRSPENAVYVGDSVDDAIASQSARVPFVGVLFGRGAARLERNRLLRERGAIAVMNKAADLEPWLNRNLLK
jgi:phosphoglycolate phosphatase-like HAD superfamily hydrolase